MQVNSLDLYCGLVRHINANSWAGLGAAAFWWPKLIQADLSGTSCHTLKTVTYRMPERNDVMYQQFFDPISNDLFACKHILTHGELA